MSDNDFRQLLTRLAASDPHGFARYTVILDRLRQERDTHGRQLR